MEISRALPSVSTIDSPPGDTFGFALPADAEALRRAGPAFLTRAFRAAGVLSPDNEVAAVTRFEDCPGGSTGRKLLLSVDYARSQPGLPTDLFVKFSRDFDDPLRDRGKDQLESEVRFALLSRVPGFPIRVPMCLFADYHHASGTGLLVTERIAFGRDGVEPPHEKCMDYAIPAPLEHYQVLMRSLARLAGTHKAGRLPASVAEQFPFTPDRPNARDAIPYSAQQLQNRVARYGVFAAEFPQLLPANIRSPGFIAALSADVVGFLEQEAAIKAFLNGDPDFIALCHWNANIDNAWFWRDGEGRLHCGLMDWGRVNQMNVAFALLGCLSAAEASLWDDHLDDLLAVFAAEYALAGGPRIEPAALKDRLCLFAAMMLLSWLIDAPPIIRAQVPDLAEAKDRFDPRLRDNETARAQLHMLTIFLHLWETQGFRARLEAFRRREG
jgi:hypothetical protein